MSSRESMWFCHQCHAEMRPLMVPDPICASCHGDFVEKLDDPSNDPREFAHGGGQGEPGEPIQEDGFDNFFIALQTLLNRGMQQPPQQRSTTQPSSQTAGPRVTFQFSSSGDGPRSFSWGTATPPVGSPTPNALPTMSEFVQHRDEGEMREGPRISGPLFAHYLMSLLGQTDHPMLPMFMGGVPEGGRMGDYVFSQEALDQIITQIMESSNAHRPVAASEEVIQKLPREVLMQGSPLLSEDCAVCKEQFQLGTEDPDEQIIITLPCKHPFHQPCILPWLKSSGTCPVCRYALVPQPSANGGPPNNQTASSPPTSTSQFGASPRTRSQSPMGGHRSSRSGGGSSESYRGGSGTGIFTQLFGNLAGSAHGSAGGAGGPSPSPTSPTSPSSSSRGPRSRSSVDGSIPSFTWPPSHSQSPTPTPTYGGFGYSTSQRDRERERERDQQQNQSSNRNGSRRGNSGGRQSPRSHVPGQWTDDMMDLD